MSSGGPFQTARSMLGRAGQPSSSQESFLDSSLSGLSDGEASPRANNGTFDLPRRQPLVGHLAVGGSRSAQRLVKEVQEINQEPPPGCSAGPKGDNLYEWAAAVDGPEKTVYEGGTFFLELSLGKEYPFEPPKVTFLTRIYHCNIDSHGTICLDVLRDRWSPTMSIKSVLYCIVSLMSDCNPHDPLVSSIAQQYLNNRSEFERTARLWTQRYAR
uniref:E2 ubiquitin-conjugating enzyme n=1 Tax=Plectus sambesii TaxID=2011161 RepID=A0A914X135_9BILA